jgi:hypothetical protein
MDGHDIINILVDQKRRGADATKLAQIHHRLRKDDDGNDLEILADHATRIKQILDGSYQDERNLAHEAREWVENCCNGVFILSEITKAIGANSRTAQKNLSKILNRMASEEGSGIEKHGNKNGCYRRVVPTETLMDLTNVDMTQVKISLPLNIHKKTILFKKAIICVAGVTGTGKTSMALNFIRDNLQNPRPIWYMNQEMHEQALIFKLTNFQTMSLKDWMINEKFFPLKDITDYATSIRPNDINIIDYLEAPQSEFWKIAESIRAIERRLNDGVALILLQRKTNALWGEGAEFSARASSLYVNMEWGAVEVVKNRYREGDQFKGFERRNFDIKNGLMVPTSGWYSTGASPSSSTSSNNKKEKTKAKTPASDPDFIRDDGE